MPYTRSDVCSPPSCSPASALTIPGHACSFCRLCSHQQHCRKQCGLCRHGGSDPEPTVCAGSPGLRCQPGADPHLRGSTQESSAGVQQGIATASGDQDMWEHAAACTPVVLAVADRTIHQLSILVVYQGCSLAAAHAVAVLMQQMVCPGLCMPCSRLGRVAQLCRSHAAVPVGPLAAGCVGSCLRGLTAT